MKIIILVGICFFGLINHANAQRDFIPGRIVLTNGDTIKGLIQKINQRITPENVVFKTPSESKIQSLPASRVRSFRYNGGEWYFSYAGPLETSSLHDSELTYDSSMHTTNDTLFIRCVLFSKASLFYARDRNDRTHLFFSMNGEGVRELAYKKYYVDEIVIANYRNQIIRRSIMGNEMYKGQLIQAFSDCMFLVGGILSRPMQYNKNDLLDLFEDYNRCRASKIIYREEKDKGRLEVSLQGGLSVSDIKIVTNWQPWSFYNFNQSYDFQGGVAFNYFLPRTGNRFSFYNEILLKPYQLRGVYKENNATTVTLSSLYAKVITTGRYTLQGHGVLPFFELGISNSFLLYSNIDSSNLVEENARTMFRDFRGYEQGLIISSGVEWKKLTGLIRLEKSNGFSPYGSLRTSFTTWYLQAGYIF